MRPKSRSSVDALVLGFEVGGKLGERIFEPVVAANDATVRFSAFVVPCGDDDAVAVA